MGVAAAFSTRPRGAEHLTDWCWALSNAVPYQCSVVSNAVPYQCWRSQNDAADRRLTQRSSRPRDRERIHRWFHVKHAGSEDRANRNMFHVKQRACRFAPKTPRSADSPRRRFPAAVFPAPPHLKGPLTTRVLLPEGSLARHSGAAGVTLSRRARQLEPLEGGTRLLGAFSEI